MQFSLRRMLLAVGVFAATLGTFSFYAKRCGMFGSASDPTCWWLVVITVALGTGGLVLVLHRRDLGRTVEAMIWVVVGLIVGSMLSGPFHK